MATKPADRYASVTELSTDIDAFQGGFATSVNELAVLESPAICPQALSDENHVKARPDQPVSTPATMLTPLHYLPARRKVCRINCQRLHVSFGSC